MTPERELFWKIGLAGSSMPWRLGDVPAAGRCRCHLRVWLKGAPKGKIAFSQEALKQAVSDVLLGLRVLKGEVAAGIMHALIFWGFIILTIVPRFS